jgi:hypothetical protein
VTEDRDRPNRCQAEAVQSLENNQTSGRTFRGYTHRVAISNNRLLDTVSTVSWRALQMARMLLQRPVELFVVSRPFNQFPQELCLRFGLNWDWQHQAGGGSTGTAPPYDDLVEDLCAFITLLSRRLVVPAVESRVSFGHDAETKRLGSFRNDVPSPMIGLGNLSGLGLRVSRAERTAGAVALVDHTPPALGVDPSALEHAFSSLCRSSYAREILQAARAYSSALQLILPRPELAYQLLISAVESLSNRVFNEYQPCREDMIERKRGVATKAKSFGLSPEQAEELALEACKDEY